jgi:hypothetical protein
MIILSWNFVTHVVGFLDDTSSEKETIYLDYSTMIIVNLGLEVSESILNILYRLVYCLSQTFVRQYENVPIYVKHTDRNIIGYTIR